MARQKKRSSGMHRAAESIGASLGHLQARYDAWIKQRDVIAAELETYLASAQRMLSEIGHTADAARIRVVRSVIQQPPGRRVMSAEARQRISAGAKALWAKRKAGKRKQQRNVSPEVRAKLSRLAKERWAKAKRAGKTRLG
jgi:hypothetical protein